MHATDVPLIHHHDKISTDIILNEVNRPEIAALNNDPP